MLFRSVSGRFGKAVLGVYRLSAGCGALGSGQCHRIEGRRYRTTGAVGRSAEREPLKLRQHHNVLKYCVDTIKFENVAGKIDIDKASQNDDITIII